MARAITAAPAGTPGHAIVHSASDGPPPRGPGGRSSGASSGEVDRAAGCPRPAGQLGEQFERGVGRAPCPGAEDRRRAGRTQLRRSPAAGSRRRRPPRMSSRVQRRAAPRAGPASGSGVRPRGVDPDDVDVRLDRPGGPPRPASGTAAPTSTSKPRSANAVAITFSPAVVAVLAHLGHQDARPAALGLGERGGRRPCLFDDP